MSPTVVVAWMFRPGVPPVFRSALRTRPTVVPASRAAETPAGSLPQRAVLVLMSGASREHSVNPTL